MWPTTEPEQNTSTITTTSVAELKQAPPDRGRVFENAVVLSEIGWDEYVSLRDKPGNIGLRMTFADGELEIMTLSSFHELAGSEPERVTGCLLRTVCDHSVVHGTHGNVRTLP